MSSTDWSADTLVGGHPALDLVNTAGGATKQRDRERLHDYAGVTAWAVAADLLSEPEAATLTARAREMPAQAAAARDSLCRFREALHALLLAGLQEDRTPSPSRPAVETLLQETLQRARLTPDATAFAWTATVERSGLSLVQDRAALAAHALLTGPELRRVRSCARCSWLFLDRSRGRPRRWCSMATCGNRAKAQRHYQRTRAAG